MSHTAFDEDVQLDEAMSDMYDEDFMLDGELTFEDRAQQDSDAGLFRNDGFAFNNLTEDDLSYD
jgi:hypothetical protein